MTEETTLITNRRTEPAVLIVEPWGERVPLAALQCVRLVARGRDIDVEVVHDGELIEFITDKFHASNPKLILDRFTMNAVQHVRLTRALDCSLFLKELKNKSHVSRLRREDGGSLWLLHRWSSISING
jgi:hypothetical protein